MSLHCIPPSASAPLVSSRPLKSGNIQIPANTVDSFILADATLIAFVFQLPQAPASASSFALARAFDHADVDTLRHFDHHGYAIHSAYPQPIPSELVPGTTPDAAVSNYLVLDEAAPHIATKQESGIDAERGHDSCTSDESINDQNEDNLTPGDVSGEKSPDDGSSDGNSSDEESSDDSSDNEEDDATFGLARVRALNLPPGLSFTRARDGKTRWPCNQCHRDWSRRDETRRHLRDVHCAQLHNGHVPMQKGLEQARIGCL
ncbi:hypothetical protein LY76DRAFT_669323 [Colletotrichum caudatum]|nr:hypothetical protein LY76DRAFT_669323 [Colletotrichum caudatum]